MMPIRKLVSYLFSYCSCHSAGFIYCIDEIIDLMDVHLKIKHTIKLKNNDTCCFF